MLKPKKSRGCTSNAGFIKNLNNIRVSFCFLVRLIQIQGRHDESSRLHKLPVVRIHTTMRMAFQTKCVVLQLPLSGMCVPFTSSTLLTLRRSFIKPFGEHISHTSSFSFFQSDIGCYFVVVVVVVLFLSLFCIHLCHSLVSVPLHPSQSPPPPPPPPVLLPASRFPSFYSPVALVNMINSTPLFSSPPLFQMITPVSGCRPWRGNRAPITLMQITLM